MAAHFAKQPQEIKSPMWPRISALVALALVQSTFDAYAERIKRKPPTDAELARLASDEAMNDGILRKGDIISTDRGFFKFLGSKDDGSYDFVPIPNPFSAEKQGPRNLR